MTKLRTWLKDENGNIRWCIKHVFMLKLFVLIGLTAAYFLPSHYAILASCCANAIWLWRV